MVKIELELSDTFVEQAKTQASMQHITVEQLFADILQQQLRMSSHGHSSLGLFADEPEMMDQVMELIRSERDKPLVDRMVTLE